MSAFKRYLLAGTFSAMVLLPVALFGVEVWKTDYPTHPFPTTLSRQTPREFDRWFTSHLGFKYLRMRIGALTQFGILRRSTSPLIVIGDDKWLFLADVGPLSPPPRIEDIRGTLRLPAAIISAIDRKLVETSNRLASCGIAFQAFIAPNKQSVYGDKLANGAWPAAENRTSDLLAKLSPEAQATIDYPRQAMLDFRSKDEALLYNSTGSHWTELGAWIAFDRLAKRLQERGNLHAPERAALSNFKIASTLTDGENMDAMVIFAKELFSDFDVRLSPLPVTSKPDRDPLLNPGFTRHTFTNPDGKGHLVFFGDSFGERIVPFFARHFAKVTHFTYPGVVPGIIEREAPNVVILEGVERNIEVLPQLINSEIKCPQAKGAP